MNEEVLWSSKKMDWATPQAFFDQLDAEFHFTLDPCADESNHKCDQYFTEEDDGLKQSWEGATVFCNPPYGKAIKDWVRKGMEEARKPGTTVVMLIPARTDTAYFHDYIYKKPNVEVRFIRGRLKFGEAENPAPFPSMVVISRWYKACDGCKKMGGRCPYRDKTRFYRAEEKRGWATEYERESH